MRHILEDMLVWREMYCKQETSRGYYFITYKLTVEIKPHWLYKYRLEYIDKIMICFNVVRSKRNLCFNFQKLLSQCQILTLTNTRPYSKWFYERLKDGTFLRHLIHLFVNRFIETPVYGAQVCLNWFFKVWYTCEVETPSLWTSVPIPYFCLRDNYVYLHEFSPFCVDIFTPY